MVYYSCTSLMFLVNGANCIHLLAIAPFSLQVKAIYKFIQILLSSLQRLGKLFVRTTLVEIIFNLNNYMHKLNAFKNFLKCFAYIYTLSLLRWKCKVAQNFCVSQYQSYISRTRTESLKLCIYMEMNGYVFDEKSSFKMFVLPFSSQLDQGSYILSVAKNCI